MKGVPTHTPPSPSPAGKPTSAGGGTCARGSQQQEPTALLRSSKGENGERCSRIHGRESTAGFGGRDLVGRDLVACSRFWGRDRVATAVVRGASPFWGSSFVRATNRHGRDHRQICRSPLVLSVGHAEWRKLTETPGCQFIGFPGLPSPSPRQSQCTHLRIPRPPLVGGAVPRCPRSPVQTSAPVPVPVPVFALGSG